MKHLPYDEWLKYVKDEVDEKARELFESHMYTCDHCLELYFQAVSAYETSLPILTNEGRFADKVMSEVNKLNVAKPRLEKPFYQQIKFHYLLAAVATLLLTFSGVFHSIAEYAGTVENPHFQEKRSSVTEGFIDKTFAWMDSLEQKNKEVNKK